MRARVRMLVPRSTMVVESALDDEHEVHVARHANQVSSVHIVVCPVEYCAATLAFVWKFAYSGSTQPRSHGPDPYWWKQGAGTPYPTGVRQCLFNNHLKGSFSSAVIYREATHDQNLSGGVYNIEGRFHHCVVTHSHVSEP